MIAHPGERRLLAFQDGRLPDAARRRLAGHLADCQQCRDVVQGHRAVRAVLRLDTPSAPDGVLERILASRAEGALVVLPVADPEPGRRPVRGMVALAMALAAVLVISLVPVIPMTPLAGAWKWWIGFIVDWHPFSSDANGPRPELLKAPMAEPMVFDPSRMKPFEARYVTEQSNPARDRDPVTGKSSYKIVREVDSSFVIRLIDDRLRSGEWITWSSTREAFLGDGIVTLDAHTLAPHAWGSVKDRRQNFREETRFRLNGTTLITDVRYGGIVPPATLNARPPGTYFDTLPPNAVNALTIGEADLYVRFMALHLGRTWSGSTLEPWGSSRARPLGWTRRTYYVNGSARFPTPAGTFEAWRVRRLDEDSFDQMQYYIRKSDGLYLGSESRIQQPGYSYTVRLLSTTLDAPTATTH